MATSYGHSISREWNMRDRQLLDSRKIAVQYCDQWSHNNCANQWNQRPCIDYVRYVPETYHPNPPTPYSPYINGHQNSSLQLHDLSGPYSPRWLDVPVHHSGQTLHSVSSRQPCDYSQRVWTTTDTWHVKPWSSTRRRDHFYKHPGHFRGQSRRPPRHRALSDLSRSSCITVKSKAHSVNRDPTDKTSEHSVSGPATALPCAASEPAPTLDPSTMDKDVKDFKRCLTGEIDIILSQGENNLNTDNPSQASAVEKMDPLQPRQSPECCREEDAPLCVKTQSNSRCVVETTCTIVPPPVAVVPPLEPRGSYQLTESGVMKRDQLSVVDKEKGKSEFGVKKQLSPKSVLENHDCSISGIPLTGSGLVQVEEAAERKERKESTCVSQCTVDKVKETAMDMSSVSNIQYTLSKLRRMIDKFESWITPKPNKENVKNAFNKHELVHNMVDVLHVLSGRHNENSTPEHKSSWLNVNENIDDIDHDLGVAWSQAFIPKGVKAERIFRRHEVETKTMLERGGWETETEIQTTIPTRGDRDPKAQTVRDAEMLKEAQTDMNIEMRVGLHVEKDSQIEAVTKLNNTRERMDFLPETPTASEKNCISPCPIKINCLNVEDAKTVFNQLQVNSTCFIDLSVLLSGDTGRHTKHQDEEQIVNHNNTPGLLSTEGKPESSGTDNEPTESSGTDNEPTESSGTDNEPTESSGTDNEPTESSGTDNEPTESSGTDNEPAESSGTDNEPTESSGTDNEPTESSGTDNEPAVLQASCSSYLIETADGFELALNTTSLKRNSSEFQDGGLCMIPVGGYFMLDDYHISDLEDTEDVINHSTTLDSNRECALYHSEAKSHKQRKLKRPKVTWRRRLLSESESDMEDSHLMTCLNANCVPQRKEPSSLTVTGDRSVILKRRRCQTNRNRDDSNRRKRLRCSDAEDNDDALPSHSPTHPQSETKTSECEDTRRIRAHPSRSSQTLTEKKTNRPVIRQTEELLKTATKNLKTKSTELHSLPIPKNKLYSEQTKKNKSDKTRFSSFKSNSKSLAQKNRKERDEKMHEQMSFEREKEPKGKNGKNKPNSLEKIKHSPTARSKYLEQKTPVQSGDVSCSPTEEEEPKKEKRRKEDMRAKQKSSVRVHACPTKKKERVCKREEHQETEGDKKVCDPHKDQYKTLQAQSRYNPPEVWGSHSQSRTAKVAVPTARSLEEHIKGTARKQLHSNWERSYYRTPFRKRRRSGFSEEDPGAQTSPEERSPQPSPEERTPQPSPEERTPQPSPEERTPQPSLEERTPQPSLKERSSSFGRHTREKTTVKQQEKTSEMARRQGPIPCDNARKPRRSSQDYVTPLMKKSMEQAKTWTNAIHHRPLEDNQRSSHGTHKAAKQRRSRMLPLGREAEDKLFRLKE